MSLGISVKKLHLVKIGAFVLETASKFALFSLSGFKDEKFIKEQTYTKTETCKLYCQLYSRVFWTFVPNVIKIDLYNFELYRFKVYACFLRHSVWWTSRQMRILNLPGTTVHTGCIQITESGFYVRFQRLSTTIDVEWLSNKSHLWLEGLREP